MRLGAAALGILLALVAFSPPVRAGKVTRDQCVSASEDGQLAKVKGQLHSAREKLTLCTDKACPKLVRQDCSAALDEIDKAMPSVVFGAHDAAGKDLSDVAVSVDGVELVKHLDGKAVEVDPGPHTFRFESPGLPAREESVVVREGEKSRVIEVRLGEPKQSKKNDSPAAPAKPSGEDRSRGPSTATWVMGGIGAAALVGAGVVGYVALQKRSSLYDRCGKSGTCEQSEVDSVYRLYDISYIGAGVGGALLATSVVLYLTGKPSEPKKEGRLSVSPTLGGVSVRGRF